MANQPVVAFELPGGFKVWAGDTLPSLVTDGVFMAGDYFWVTAIPAPTFLYRCVTSTTATVAPTWTAADQTDAQNFNFTALTANGAINPNLSATYSITKAGVLADTLAAPTVDGVTITITSNTAFAHTITATGLLQTGSASVNVATFAAFAGASLQLVSIGGKWSVLTSNGVTFT
jgi:hypothetical protein